MGFDRKHLRRALKRTTEALDAETPLVRVTKDGTTWEEGGEADHDVRLKAAKQIYGLVGLDGQIRAGDTTDPGRPVSVTIVLANAGTNGHANARTALPAGGVRLHLGDTNGGGA